MKNPLVIFFTVFVVLVGVVFFMQSKEASKPGEYDTFAQCVSDSGAKMYGAFWCPHCESQRNMFGNSRDFLPYVECSTPDRQSQVQECIDAEIQSYPTWILSDGTRINGVQEFEQIAEFSGCELVKDSEI